MQFLTFMTLFMFSISMSQLTSCTRKNTQPTKKAGSSKDSDATPSGPSERISEYDPEERQDEPIEGYGGPSQQQVPQGSQPPLSPESNLGSGSEGLGGPSSFTPPSGNAETQVTARLGSLPQSTVVDRVVVTWKKLKDVPPAGSKASYNATFSAAASASNKVAFTPTMTINYKNDQQKNCEIKTTNLTTTESQPHAATCGVAQ